ncbi:hypothetical protein AGMMS49982_07510 [Bacteroidia bacterium]|nr:hypothetical protein AGMMS49982_07510 [Bacteroidia bacterium]
MDKEKIYKQVMSGKAGNGAASNEWYKAQGLDAAQIGEMKAYIKYQMNKQSPAAASPAKPKANAKGDKTKNPYEEGTAAHKGFEISKQAGKTEEHESVVKEWRKNYEQKKAEAAKQQAIPVTVNPSVMVSDATNVSSPLIPYNFTDYKPTKQEQKEFKKEQNANTPYVIDYSNMTDYEKASRGITQEQLSKGLPSRGVSGWLRDEIPYGSLLSSIPPVAIAAAISPKVRAGLNALDHTNGRQFVYDIAGGEAPITNSSIDEDEYNELTKMVNENAVITKSDIILAGICPLFTLIPGYIIYKVMKTNKKLGICLLILFFVLPAGLGIPTENTLDEIAKIIVLLSPVIIYLIWMYQKKNKKNHSTEIEQTENLLEEKL